MYNMKRCANTGIGLSNVSLVLGISESLVILRGAWPGGTSLKVVQNVTKRLKCTYIRMHYLIFFNCAPSAL